ncbi:hypothetical protein L6164_007903 [Bauhinia variegata]|uniref:Uncharacterized protein n=1 Tax=Bauhinia variegata TaxID=167791 RepID=A0ACB9PDX5_BAUVA|nr:hypothetical protein L6164_007903 [Bauhinia variegata]
MGLVTWITSKQSRKIKVSLDQNSGINLSIGQAKNFAVAQAQQDGCTACYRIFDSPFGNFLVPVVPNLAELEINSCSLAESYLVKLQALLCSLNPSAHFSKVQYLLEINGC